MTRVFTVEVTGCKDCPNSEMAFGWLDCCNHKSLANTNDWKILAKLYRENKDQITESCPMYQQSFAKDEKK